MDEEMRPDGRQADTGTGAAILDLTRERMTRLSPVLEETWRYWNAKRPVGDIPARSSLEPRAMQLILGHALILDRVRPGTVRVRLGGRIPNALVGVETRGLPARAFFDLMQRGEAAELIEQCFEAPATLELDLISDGTEGRVTARMLVLPLRDRTGAVSKALSVIVPNRLTNDGPRRFKIVRHTVGALAVTAAPRPRTRTRRSPDVPSGFEAVLAHAQVTRGIGAAARGATGTDDGGPNGSARGDAVAGAPWLRVVK